MLLTLNCQQSGCCSRAGSPHGRPQSGFSIVELMIAITLGLMILAGLTTVFVNSSRARNEIEKANQQTENGRYALQLLTEDLKNSGFLAEFDPSALASPASVPDFCSTSLTTLKSALVLHVQGQDNPTTAPSCTSDLHNSATVMSDILVVRRASTCVAGTIHCEDLVNGYPYFQASSCANGTELNSTNTDRSTNFYALNTDTTQLLRHKKDCATLSDIYRYRTHVYYVANNDNPGDGIPTLMRAELGSNFTSVPLVEGIEALQIVYGIDNTNDGIPDVYVANPNTYNSCGGIDCSNNWRHVVAVQIYLLARNTQKTAGYLDSKTYNMGIQANGTALTMGPFNDAYKRHAYQVNIRLNNPAGRLTS